MASIRFEILKQWFERLAAIEASERVQYLESHAEIDDGMRNELLRLLRADERLVGHTARTVLGVHSEQVLDSSMVGRRVGAYLVDRLLGRGGMGSVFLAHRVDGSVEQLAAIKIVRPEVLDQHTVARFHLERQVLALLRHPNIATLLDAGELPDGRPYVVMEYVEGESLIAWADSHRLDVRDRLALFLKVCDAVGFAHRNLVVHRDLKPGNVLVAHDGQPKLLDFGIAKPLTGAIGAMDVPQTADAQRFFSPHNAAPEQVRGEPITPACDVYGLGTMLYEMLTGNKALDLQHLTPSEAELRILEDDPEPPSRNVSTSIDASSRKGRERELAGDLDAITLKCLRKQTSDRYRSVDQLVSDVGAYLAGFPVSAQRGGHGYRLRRFAGRHRFGLTVAAISMALVIIGAASWFQQYGARLEQQHRADQTLNIVLSALNSVDPNSAQNKDLSAMEVFDRISARVEGDNAMPGSVRARLRADIATIYERLGEPQRALEILDKLPTAATDRVQDDLALRTRFQALLALNRIDDAEQLVRSRRSVVSEPNEQIYWSLAEAQMLDMKGDLDGALRLLTETQIPKGDPMGDRRHWLSALAWQGKGEAEKARQMFEELLDSLQKRGSAGTIDAVGALLQIAMIESRSGLQQEADVHARRALSMAENALPDNAAPVLAAKSVVGMVLWGQEKLAEAIVVFEDLLASQTEKFGPVHPQVARMHFNLAGLYARVNDREQSNFHFKRASFLAEQVWPASHSNVLLFQVAHATALLSQLDFQQAAEVIAPALANIEQHPQLRNFDISSLAALIDLMCRHRANPSSDSERRVVAQFADARQTEGRSALTALSELSEVAITIGIKMERVPMPD